jgi:hypothetical protein
LIHFARSVVSESASWDRGAVRLVAREVPVLDRALFARFALALVLARVEAAGFRVALLLVVAFDFALGFVALLAAGFRAVVRLVVAPDLEPVRLLVLPFVVLVAMLSSGEVLCPV